jgi:hypothetical protein
MIDMDYVLVDYLSPDQLEIDDLIGVEGEVVRILSISPLRYGYSVTIENEFGERDVVDFNDDEQINLYVMQ